MCFMLFNLFPNFLDLIKRRLAFRIVKKDGNALR